MTIEAPLDYYPWPVFSNTERIRFTPAERVVIPETGTYLVQVSGSVERIDEKTHYGKVELLHQGLPVPLATCEYVWGLNSVFRHVCSIQRLIIAQSGDLFQIRLTNLLESDLEVSAVNVSGETCV